MSAEGPRPTGTVTFLFTDIEGSTRMWQESPDVMSAALVRHDEIVRAAIESARGYVFSTGGDGFAAAFWIPAEAVAAATSAQARLAGEVWPGPVVIRVRMGIHTGTAAERDGDYFGPTLNRAARLMAVGHGGQVLLSNVTASLVDHLDLVDLGEHRLKDLAGTERVWQLGTESFRPLRSIDAHQAGQRPSAPSGVIGRAVEMADVVALLATHRVVSLVGAGGVGKTTLALSVLDAVADKFPDGIWWVDLASLDAGGDVSPGAATVLRVRDHSGTGFGPALAAALAEQRLLLVLDNCEHVLDSAAELVSRLIAHCPGVSMLCTSRTRLGVATERDFPIRPLPVDGNDSAAFELLTERIGRPEITANPAERAALQDICARLDGLPLALELAAARCRVMTPTAVATRLRERLRLPAGRGAPLGARATLEGTVQWSHDLLTPTEQSVLARLSVFAGTFSLEAAESVGAGADLDRFAVDDGLAALVEQSLVDHDSGRYRLLETTRAFARDRLDEAGEAAAIEAAHVEWVRGFVRATRLGLRGPDEARFVEVLDADWANVRAAFLRALEWSDPDPSTEIVIHLFIEAAYRRSEIHEWIDVANTRNGDVDHTHRHELVAAAAWLAGYRGDANAALALGRDAVALDPAPGTAIDRLPQWAMAGALLAAGRSEEACAAMLPVLSTVKADPFLDVFWSFFYTWALTIDGRDANEIAILECEAALGELAAVLIRRVPIGNALAFLQINAGEFATIVAVEETLFVNASGMVIRHDAVLAEVDFRDRHDSYPRD